MINDYFFLRDSLNRRTDTLLLSDIERIRMLRLLRRAAGKRLAELLKLKTFNSDDILREMTVLKAVRREINKRERSVFCSEFWT